MKKKQDQKQLENRLVNENKLERRTFQVSELRVVDSAGGPVVKGHAAVFNKLSEDLGGFREKIAPGAFKQAIRNSDVRALFNHDPNFVLGRSKNKTLTLSEDKDGLYMEVVMPDTQIIRDLVLAPIRRGDIREQSFGFTVAKDGDSWEGLEEDRANKPPTRTINTVARLFDVSPVTFPAYPDTDVAARSLDKAIEEFKTKDGFKAIDATEEVILNSLSNLEDFKEVFKDKEEDEIRDHFKQLVMNFVAFVSPDAEFNSYDELITKIEPAVIEPTQDAVDEKEIDEKSSVEPTQDRTNDGNNDKEPTPPLADNEEDPIMERLKKFQNQPFNFDDWN